MHGQPGHPDYALVRGWPFSHAEVDKEHFPWKQSRGTLAWEWGGEKEQLNQGSALLGLAEASKFRATLLPMPVPMSVSFHVLDRR